MIRSPHAVVFDLGKVLLNFDYRIAVRRLAAHSALSAEAVARLLPDSPLLLRYERGEMPSLTFFEEFRDATRYRADYATFRQHFADIFSPIDAMLALHALLHRRGVPCYVLSNTNEIAITHIRHRYPFIRNFQGLVLSFEHGMLKPDPKLYHAVEKLARCRGGRLFYLDDRPENVATAQRLGWQANLHRNPTISRQAFRAAGLL